jgi:hypothetical protein
LRELYVGAIADNSKLEATCCELPEDIVRNLNSRRTAIPRNATTQFTSNYRVMRNIYTFRSAIDAIDRDSAGRCSFD